MKIIAASLIASVAAFAPSARFSRTTSLNADILSTIATLEGPGQVWGADGIAVGKEESDFKASDNFNLFAARCQSTGFATTLAGPGPFTVFAPTDTAIESYEKMTGPVTADVLAYCVAPGALSVAAVSSTPMTALSGQAITYSRKFRKDFVNDAILGEKTFGPFADFPVDVACDNGVIHSVGILITPQ